MSKILITGGAGFIGFHLAKKLIECDFHVDILDDFSRAVKDPELEKLFADPKVRCISCDLTSQKEVLSLPCDYQYIFHLAAIIGVQHVLDKPYEVLTKNIEMMSNIIAIARKQTDLQRIIYTSTSEVYAGTLKYFDLPIPTSEDTPLAITDTAEPRTTYMLSKIYGEAMCQHSSLPYTIIRPHNIYGPRMGMSHVIPELLKRAIDTPDNQKLTVYSMSHKRTFCYIDDAVELFYQFMKSENCINKTLNLGTQEPETSIAELSTIILNTVRKNLQIEPGPVTPGSPSRRAPDMNQAVDLVNFRAKISLQKGVMKTFEWYNKNVFQPDGITAK